MSSLHFKQVQQTVVLCETSIYKDYMHYGQKQHRKTKENNKIKPCWLTDLQGSWLKGMEKPTDAWASNSLSIKCMPHQPCLNNELYFLLWVVQCSPVCYAQKLVPGWIKIPEQAVSIYRAITTKLASAGPIV